MNALNSLWIAFLRYAFYLRIPSSRQVRKELGYNISLAPSISLQQNILEFQPTIVTATALCIVSCVPLFLESSLNITELLHALISKSRPRTNRVTVQEKIRWDHLHIAILFRVTGTRIFIVWEKFSHPT